MSTVLTNGPVSNRLNIVILSEGYTSGQLAQFMQDATNSVNNLLAHNPYFEYRSYCNAFAIAVPSNQSGSDHPTGTYRDTYFNSTYDPISDRLITIPPDFADTDYSHGQGKIDALITSFMPQCHLPILLVNDFTPGGSDGFDNAAISSIADFSGDILTHETGHVLANLGDEYTNAYPGFPDTEEPNTTRETRPDSIKWKVWINTNTTPIPTPPTAQYASVVGLFQGAHYHVTNWYRPKLNCLMGSQGSAFCEVCSETMVLAFYARVRPVDGFLPVNTNVLITTSEGINFSVTPLQPATHALTIQWLTNNVPFPAATNTTFSVFPQTLGSGTQSVSVIVRDSTPLVRNDPAKLLSQQITWTLTIPQLQLDSVMKDAQFVFRVSGNAPQGFALEASTNLVHWIPILTNSLTGGQYWYTNPGMANSGSKFFRAVTPP